MDFTDLEALLGESLPPDTRRDVWVLAHSAASMSLVGYARELADSLGVYVCVVAPSRDGEPVAADDCLAYGADRVYRLPIDAEAVPTGALLACFGDSTPEFVLLEKGDEELAGRLAARLHGGLVTDCASFRLDESRRRLVASHPVYGGEYLLDVEVTDGPQIFTLAPDRLPVPARDPGRTGEVLTPELPAGGFDSGVAVRVERPGVDFQPPARPFSKARRNVAVGRGLRDPEAVEVARGLAACLGAEFGGDRSALDSGWIDEARLVGVTGNTVAPRLYLALGVWGDTLHNAAIEASGLIVAIHPDPDAPILKIADAGVVADPTVLLPKLLAALSG